MHHRVHFKLSNAQMHKLAHAYKSGTGVNFKLHRGHIHPNGIPLDISDTHYRNLMTYPTAHTIHISADHVKSGGFLGALLSALPTIASVIGGISGLTGIASNLKTMISGNGMHRHRAHRANGLYLNSSGGHGLITDHIGNIPIITPALKFLGLGSKKRRHRRK